MNKLLLTCLLTSAVALVGCTDDSGPKGNVPAVSQNKMDFVTWDNLSKWAYKDVHQTPIFKLGVIADLIKVMMSSEEQALLKEAADVVDVMRQDKDNPSLYYITGNKSHAAQDLSFYVIINMKMQSVEVGLFQNHELTKYRSNTDIKSEYPTDVIFMLDNLLSIPLASGEMKE